MSVKNVKSETIKTKSKLLPSFYPSKFKCEGCIKDGEIYVCDDLKNVVVNFCIDDAENNSEIALKALEVVVKDFIESKKRDKK